MTFSQAQTVAGWVVIGLAIGAATAVARATRGRFPSAVAVVRAATRGITGRVIGLAAWAWVGWHFFVRTTR
jgi:Family of unknown function (DUF6186)